MPNKILIGALALVKKGWTQGALARDQRGQPVASTDLAACAWCSGGAKYRASIDLMASTQASRAAWEALITQMGGSVPIFNDSHTKAEVVAAFKAAIEATKGNLS